MSLYDAKLYHEAASLLRKVAGRNSKMPTTYYYLGMIGVKQRNNAAIRHYFTKLAALCPEYPMPLAHYWMAVILYTDSNYDGAVKELNLYFDLANHANDKEALALYQDASNYLYWSRFLADAYAHPVPFVPHKLGGISSDDAETLPYVTWDGHECYFLRMVPGKPRDEFYQSTIQPVTPYLMLSTWGDSAFSKGIALPAPFNQHEHEGSITITADGNTLYYSIVTTERGYDNCDIYCSHREHESWQELQNAGRNVNSSNSWESQPSITADGQWLYFASNRDGGYGGTDIWRCHRLPNGDWSRAENLGERVNTEGDEKCPFIHADGHTLYFASNGWQGFGGYDEYYIDLHNAAQMRPVNLGLPVNSENDMLCFSVSADGCTAYYSDNEDVYTFQLHEAARPAPMAFVTVHRHDLPDTAYMLSLKDTNFIVSYSEGHFPYFAIMNGCPADIRVLTVSPAPLVLNRKYPLPSSSYHFVDALAVWLLQHPRIHIRIEGLCADTVLSRLLQQGCRAERLVSSPTTSSYTTIVVTQQ